MPRLPLLRCLFCLTLALPYSGTLLAQNALPDDSAATKARWTGQWSAEGLPFVVQARTSSDHIEISPVTPAAQAWVIRNGLINDDSATIEVEYQGVTATALIRLIAEDTAIAQALTCQPDYHVICTLVRDQQARFHRLPASPGQ